jgi:two-component sensor histidine kinase/PAS domain-containing protein
LAAKGYMESGSISIITMGSGVFSLAVGSLIAGFLLPSKGPNAVITIHNISAGLSGSLHLVGAMLVFVGVMPVKDAHKRKRRLIIVFLSIFAFLVILTFGVFENFLPTFFVQGQGPTLLRQIILGIATFSFLVSGFLFMLLYKNSRNLFLYWYAAALFLISVGLGCVFIQKSFGGLIGWLGRIAQYTGGLYLVISILKGAKDVDISIMRFDKVLEKFFHNRFEVLLMERTAELEKEITENKQAEEEIRNRQIRFETILNNMDSSVYIADMKSNEILFMNNCLINSFGKDFTGKICWKSLHNDQDGPCEFCTSNKLIDTMGNPSEPYVWEIYNTILEKWYELHDQAIPWLDGRLVRMEIAIDVTERKNKEDQIKASLKEKETLLQEIHHRVKNNLTVVSSLLSLQANNMNDEKLTAALMESKRRVHSMSLIHETLYQSESLSSIDMNIYLSKLSRAVAQNFTTGSKTNLKIEAENILIGSKQASPVGLIVNELITNSYKYAFPENRNGEIKIELRRFEGQIELKYTDNGIGMPKNFDWKNSKSLGLKLVRTLVENQLDGSIEMKSNNGTKFTIKFNIET